MFVRFVRTALAAAALAASSAALAHATFEPVEVRPNANFKAVLRVPHGCGDKATHTVRIAIPEGVIAVKPMPKAGWKLETITGAYARSYDLYGQGVSSGVREIVWSGGNLEDAHYDEFAFRGRLTDGFAPGQEIFFPAVQECEGAKAAWTQIPAQGEDAHKLPSPAPSLTVAGQRQTAAPAVFSAGSIRVEAPWTRATPGGAKVAAGYMRIVNTGTAPDRLIGGSSEIADGFEVHETTTTNGVARMAPLAKGLEIPAGGTVTLVPGGHHAMLTNLKGGLVAGGTVKGTLVFDRAGPIAITYEVAPLGAKEPPGHGRHTHH